MIGVYKDTDGWISPTDEFEKGSWIHVDVPDEAEIERLHHELKVPRNFLHAALDRREVARSASNQDAHMVIVRAPYDHGAEDNVPYRTVPLAMIIMPNHFITICRVPMDVVRDLNYRYEDEELMTRRAGRMILSILGVVAEWYLSDLEEIDERLEDIEHRLKDSIENSEMLEMLRYEKSLVYLKTGLQWNGNMIEHLQGKKNFGWDEKDQVFFEDVQIEYRQGFHMAETMLTMMESMTDAFASLISNNLNVVMKFLAAVTIVLTIPMIIASIYGMNLGLPGEDYASMFVVILLISALLALGVAWLFYRRGWLSSRWHRDGRPGN